MTAIPKGWPDQWLPARINAGQVVVDVGANTGIFAEAVAARGAHVYAIEPDARCWDELRARKGRITVIPHAAAQREGEAELTQGFLSTHSSLRPSAVSEVAGTLSVRVLPLDAMVPPGPIAAVKIDTQGSEFDVLCGADRLLTECPLWIVEVWPWGFPCGVRTVKSLLDVFRAHGRHPHTLDADPRPLTDDDVLDWASRATATSFVNLVWM